MNEPTTPTTPEDILIGRIAAADEPEGGAFRAFESSAQHDAHAWERLARALRDELQTRCALERELSNADCVEVPAASFAGAPARSGAWHGWALAAVIALAWAGLGIFLPEGRERSVNVAGPSIQQAFSSPDEALDEYMRLGSAEGRIVEELPMVMIETRPLDEPGRYEVLYVRQLLERASVGSTWRIERDDLGRRTPVPIDIRSAAWRSGSPGL